MSQAHVGGAMQELEHLEVEQACTSNAAAMAGRCAEAQASFRRLAWSP